jgi:hypothetical protein
MAARRTGEAHLRSLTSVVDLTTENVRDQLLVQIALDCAKIASSYAVCEIHDWLEEAEEPPAFRWRTAIRQPKRKPSSQA